MTARPILKGTLNVSSVVRIIDSTDGTPETGVVAATAGLAFNFRREGEALVAITSLNNLALLTTAHTNGGLLHIADGYYRVDFQDAAFATGVDGVLLTGVATGMIVIGAYHPLFDLDMYDGVRGGMTALPDAAAEGAGGLYTRGTGAGQINQSVNGKIDASGDWVIGIKKNTSTDDFLFKLRLSSDHVSPATGLTPVMTVSLDGAGFVAKNAGTTIAEIGSTGWYQVDANAADLNGDRIIWKFAVATADDSELVIFTVP